MLSLNEIKQCEVHANVIIWYRANHDFMRPCWMDEWAFGYLCALRDIAILNYQQWQFLISVFATPEDFRG